LGRYGRTFFMSTGGLSTGGLSTGTVARRAVIIAAALCLLSGCGLIGRSKSTQGQVEPESMTVTSPMIENGSMAMRYTCHGAGETPPIFWSGIPPGTRSLALVVDDAATPITPRLYWIVFDISPATTDIQAGSLPTGAREARNSTGSIGYDPPCPGSAAHRYRFTIYALGTMPHQPAGATLRDAWSAIARHAIARGRLTVTALP
jgi:Raf kinase inhibitor-like YbhB/YbcL family protein